MMAEPTSPIARTYAEALWTAARRQGLVQQILEECRALGRVFDQSPQLAAFFANPGLHEADKRRLVHNILGGRLHPLLLNLLNLLIDRRRLGHLDSILKVFQEWVEQSEGVYRAVVESARELDFQQKVKLKGSLEKYTGHRLNISYHVRPELISGLVFRMGDLLVDGSARSLLNNLQRRLMAAPMPAGER